MIRALEMFDIYIESNGFEANIDVLDRLGKFAIRKEGFEHFPLPKPSMNKKIHTKDHFNLNKKI